MELADRIIPENRREIMPRYRQTSRSGPEEREDSRRRSYRVDEDARPAAGDEFAGGEDDDRRYPYGEPWPEPYPGETSSTRRFRDSWSERQSGPYRSASSGRLLSEDDYRQEARYYRSEPRFPRGR
jgi:hypothetical protein